MFQSDFTEFTHTASSNLEEHNKSHDLTQCILVDSSTVTCWMSPFVILGVTGLFCCFHCIVDGKSCYANSVDPDQMPHYVASDLGLHCLFRFLMCL